VSHDGRVDIEYTWRGGFGNDELNALHAEGFEHRLLTDDWLEQVVRHSLGWVVARDGDLLAGFVNVAWDGGVHAFLLDTLVPLTHRSQGIGRELVRIAVEGARAGGCEWLHVDYEPHLDGFYRGGGFEPTPAGLIALR
jgi:GNAT superfamily N-acetyltransferase